MAAIQLDQGTFEGLETDNGSAFHNIPYTAPYKRFQSPSPTLTSTASVHNARERGAICPQNPSSLEIVMGAFPPGTGPQNESDCGVLSIYRPHNPSGVALPVVVWIHGGAFVSGGSQIPLYDGSRFAHDGQVIVCCLSYRLGVFSFLYDEERSLAGPKLPLGTEDVIAGFEWVHKNIWKFGGDVENITVMGQSAGGYHIQCLLDHRPDLFRRAILQSPPAALVVNAEQARAVKESVIKSLPSGSTLISASTKDLLAAEKAAIVAHPEIFAIFTPTTTDDIVPGFRPRKKDRKPKDILLGWTKDDGSPFTSLGLAAAGIPEWMRHSLAKGISAAITGKLFTDGILELAKHLRNEGDRLTKFSLDWEPQGFDLGAAHCVDLPLLFGDQEAWKDSPMMGTVPWAEWDRRGKILRQAWGEFAHNGSVPKAVEGVTLHD